MTQEMNKEHAVATELYAAEAAESRKQAQAEVAIPDPHPKDAERAIAEAVASTEGK